MASYTLKANEALQRVNNADGYGEPFHHFAFRPNGTQATGTIKIEARRSGAPDNVLMDVGTYDFASPSHIDFVGPVAEWVFTLTGIDSVNLVYVTVTSTETGKADGDGIDPADKAKLDAITSTGSGEIITTAERAKINSITSVGSGEIITADERTKLDNLAFNTEEDELLEGLAFGQLYAKTVTAG